MLWRKGCCQLATGGSPSVLIESAWRFPRRNGTALGLALPGTSAAAMPSLL